MLALLAAVSAISMTAVDAAAPGACDPGLHCRTVARVRAGGARWRVVARDDRTERVYSLYVQAPDATFAQTITVFLRDVEMSTIHRTRVTRERLLAGTLADDRPVVALQLDLRERVAERRPGRLSWTTTRRSLLLVCTVDGAACLEPIDWVCRPQGCGRARLHALSLP